MYFVKKYIHIYFSVYIAEGGQGRTGHGFSPSTVKSKDAKISINSAALKHFFSLLQSFHFNLHCVSIGRQVRDHMWKITKIKYNNHLYKWIKMKVYWAKFLLVEISRYSDLIILIVKCLYLLLFLFFSKNKK